MANIYSTKHIILNGVRYKLLAHRFNRSVVGCVESTKSKRFREAMH